VRILNFSRCTLSICAAVAFLAGCGGSQVGVTNAVPQPVVRMLSRAQAASGSESDLLYLVSDVNLFYVISYPNGRLLQTVIFAGSGSGGGACTDARSNVYVAASVGSGTPGGYLFEYAHGGKTPIATLADGNYVPGGCSIDPATGNLAVTNNPNLNCEPGGNVAVYLAAQGVPTTYTDSGFQCYVAATYDDAGDLFIGGMGSGSGYLFALAELPRGASTFINITLNKQIPCRIHDGECRDSVQWDGKYISITKRAAANEAPAVYRVAVSGSSGTVVSTTTFRGKWADNTSGAVSWIQGSRIILGYRPGSLGAWKYPAGGKLVQLIIKGLAHYRYMGLTLSPSS
jgi:hypothetical protein